MLLARALSLSPTALPSRCRKYGFGVAARSPIVRTPALANRAAAAGPGGRELFVSRQPMGRLGTAEEIALLAVYLASDESAFTTGVAHIIDGGWTL